MSDIAYHTYDAFVSFIGRYTMGYSYSSRLTEECKILEWIAYSRKYHFFLITKKNI